VDQTGASFSVERATGPFFSIGFTNEQYSVIIGATAENWAAFYATGQQTWDDWEILTVTRPDGSLKQTLKGPTQHLLVWNQPTDLPPCSESPDFTGTARFLGTDSDVFLDGRGADASGHRVSGTVTDGSAQRYHFGANFLLTVAPQYNTLDNFGIVFHSTKIRPTPIGK
jgi:hypothetical protein